MHIDRLQTRFVGLYEDAIGEKIEWEKQYGEDYKVPTDKAFDEAEAFAVKLNSWHNKIATPLVKSDRFGEITLGWYPPGMDCHAEVYFKGDGMIGFEYHQKEGDDVLGGRCGVGNTTLLHSFCSLLANVYIQLWKESDYEDGNN